MSLSNIVDISSQKLIKLVDDIMEEKLIPFEDLEKLNKEILKADNEINK